MSNPNPPSGGPPLRALAMVLIALAIVFAGLGARSLSTSQASTSSSASGQGSSTTSSASTTTTTTAAPTTTTTTTRQTTTAAPTTTTAAALDKSIPVRVLNNSMITGLASKTASQLTAAGFNVVETGNLPNTSVPKTTVYYENSPKQQAVASAIASQLGTTAEPRSGAVADSPPGVIVVVTGN